MLVDTSTIVRTLQPNDPLFPVADAAIRLLPKQGRKLHIAQQNLVETWAVVTRPTANNGLGMTIPEAAAELKRLKSLFKVLAETPDTYDVWEALVVQHGVAGKQTHDARLVAAMKVHGLNSILTFNTADFKRYPNIEVVHPADVAAPA